MSADELCDEIPRSVQFYGCPENNVLIAIMGTQSVNDVKLIRHAYTMTRSQLKGLGEKLINHLLGLAKTDRILVGTWDTVSWTIKFYKKQGFTLHLRNETNKLLKKYWGISERKVETSVVLELKRQAQ